MPALNDEATLNRIVDMEVAAIVKAKLPPEQRTALDVAIFAESFRSVGEAFGKVDKNAERHGKRLVLQATKELQKILEDIEECRPLLQSAAVFQ
ncbi:hypothetical protein [Chelatococcus asaccharovorans]|uniref:Sigma-70-like protein n=1 Tax=Chelatococcus asaccharovorans TaxID=28210 RepID=A0A2V3TXY6_9HYPH|nr:hypothetical protein [Chelatococcus asaccharovorans]MBS7704750.1 hypothetical protein [Chelatococcus asaccharovorans]PXW54649.1 hypothetical protein C7450_111181 [Chelatococcus asaccharovorans]